MPFILPPKKSGPHFSDDVLRGSSRETKSGHQVIIQIGTAIAAQCGFNPNDKVECHFGTEAESGECMIVKGKEGVTLKSSANRYTITVSRLLENTPVFAMQDLSIVHANNQGLRFKLPA